MSKGHDKRAEPLRMVSHSIKACNATTHLLSCATTGGIDHGRQNPLTWVALCAFLQVEMKDLTISRSSEDRQHLAVLEIQVAIAHTAECHSSAANWEVYNGHGQTTGKLAHTH